MSDLIAGLCEKYRLVLIDVAVDESYVERTNMPLDDFVNHSYVVGRQVILGIYSDQELRTASFFHELAHRRFNYKYKEDDTPYEMEAAAWKWGLRFARRLGIEFSTETHEWCKQQEMTYEHYRRE